MESRRCTGIGSTGPAGLEPPRLGADDSRAARGISRRHLAEVDGEAARGEGTRGSHARGLARQRSGGASLISAKERKVAEQLEGNRYVGIHIALGMNDEEKRARIDEVIEGGRPIERGSRRTISSSMIDGVDTKGMPSPKRSTGCAAKREPT